MIEIGLIWLLVATEVFLVLLIALVSLLVVNTLRRRRDRQAALFLVGVVKDNERKRSEETKALLQSRFGYAGDSLEGKTHEIIKKEKLLFQRVLNMYLKRDVISLRELNIDVEAVTEPFRTLEVRAGASVADASGDGGSAGSEDVAQLQAENEALKQELQITMETMSRMLGEYASMFGGGQPVSGAASAMQQALQDGDLSDEPFGEDVIAELPDDGLDPAAPMADSPTQEFAGGLDELDGFDELEPEESRQQASDKTVAIEPTAAVDAALDDAQSSSADEDLDSLFDLDGDLFDEAAAGETAGSGSAPSGDAVDLEEMDDDLADLWADALSEQDEDEKKQA